MRERSAALALALLIAGCATTTDTPAPTGAERTTTVATGPVATGPVAAAPPAVEVTELLTGLNKPWDVAVAPDGTLFGGPGDPPLAPGPPAPAARGGPGRHSNPP
ncbi:hypothetical protein ACFWPB_24285, partial [Rhodococcus sp. NPDC058514]